LQKSWVGLFFYVSFGRIGEIRLIAKILLLAERFDVMKVKWSIGVIIHHKKYDYRGVIFSFDPFCRADDQWYHGNRTQPAREQPWYHVLVDGSETTTYVAEENLELSAIRDPVRHPLLNSFFSSYSQGRYYSASLN